MSKIPSTIVIESGKKDNHYWRDLLAYRELFFFLAWRDIKVRYKQTVLGISWAVIRPLLTLVVFTIVFGRIAKMPSNGIPYPLLVCAGILPWNYISTAFSEAGTSLITNSNLMTKVYFPRLIIPSSTILVSLLDFFIALILLFGIMIYYHFIPPLNIIFLPVFLIMSLLLSLGSGFWVAALNVRYRDFRYVIPFTVQLGLYISPVGFNASFIPEKYKLLYYLNPVAGIIDGFRWCLLDQPLYINGVISSLVVSIFLMIIGIRYFRKTERKFADVI
ncbi:MAG: ABC transporter permease [Bacteroidota bacterium]